MGQIVEAHFSLFVIAVVALALVATAAIAHLHQVRRMRITEQAIGEPQSLVHILDSDLELREAASRAAGFEVEMIRLLEQRAERYRAMSSRLSEPVSQGESRS